MRRFVRLAAALGCLAAACRPAPPAGAPDAGPATPAAPPASPPAASPGAAAGAAPAPSSAPGAAPAPAAGPAAAIPPVPMQAFAAVGGSEHPLPASGEPALVDPRSSFRVESGAPLADAHAVLLDEKGDMVPSSGTTELGPSARFLLTPREPLVAGSRYLLKVETAGGKELRDAQGRLYAPAAVALRTAGTKPAAPAPAKKKHRRGHRRR